MDYPGVRYLPNLRPPPSLDGADVAPESVDLLQMVPDSGGARVSPQPPTHPRYPDDPGTMRAPCHETPPQRRMRVLLVQDDDNIENSAREEVADLRSNMEQAEPVLANHVCHNCSREGSIYYNRQGDYECRKNHDTTRDGSVYFNYLQFANRQRTQTLPNHGSSSNYEPIERGGSVDRLANNKKAKHVKPPKPPKPPKAPKPVKTSSKERHNNTTVNNCRNLVFSCCKSTNLPRSSNNSTTTSTKAKPKSSGSKHGLIEESVYGTSLYQQQSSTGASSSSSSTPAILNNNRARKSTEWSRVKRLLFLVGILLGILVALGGIIVGFVVLAPYKGNNKVTSCVHPASVPCGDVGCVSVKAVCLGKITCPNVVMSNLCPLRNESGDALPANSGGMDGAEAGSWVTLQPNFEKPVKDASGWVYFSQGSPSGGSKYTIINRAMRFMAAQEQCRDLGGHLAHVNSIREQVFLEDYLSKELEEYEVRHDGLGFWLGARRQRGSHSGTCLYDQWKWVDVYGREHGVIRGFTAFVPEKPDNYLKWDDAPCDMQGVGSFKVLCEIDGR